eukprot:495820-Rhodomonas_salina.1
MRFLVFTTRMHVQDTHSSDTTRTELRHDPNMEHRERRQDPSAHAQRQRCTELRFDHSQHAITARPTRM